MATWIPIAIVVAALVGAGLLRERWRVSGIERWARTNGFGVQTPFTPGERPPSATLTSRFNVRGARIWGVGVEGTFDGLPVTIAECECSQAGAGKTGRWFTLVTWPISGGEGPLVVWRVPAASGTDAALRAIVGDGSDGRVSERLGVHDVDPASLRVRTSGGLLAEGEPRLREQWLSAERIRALEEWPHGGEFVRQAGYAGWRVGGLLTAARLETLRAQLPAARRLLE